MRKPGIPLDGKPAYPPFKLDEKSPAVKYAVRAVQSLGLKPNVGTSNGGLDANWLVGRHGVPTVTFGSGQAEVHTVNEYVDMSEFLQGCRLAVRLATQE